MSKTIPNIEASAEQRIKQLRAILYLLQTNLEGFKDEVDRSYDLLTKIGEKTDFTKGLEKMINDPLGNLGEISTKIDEQVKTIINQIATKYFQENKSIISSVFRSNTCLNQLHYSIVLKDDSIENRNKMFNFLDKLDLVDVVTKYPVYFQFVPSELIDKINSVEEINLA